MRSWGCEWCNQVSWGRGLGAAGPGPINIEIVRLSSSNTRVCEGENERDLLQMRPWRKEPGDGVALRIMRRVPEVVEAIAFGAGDETRTVGVGLDWVGESSIPDARQWILIGISTTQYLA